MKTIVNTFDKLESFESIANESTTAMQSAMLDMGIDSQLAFDLARFEKAVHAGRSLIATFRIPSGSPHFSMNDCKHFGLNR